MRQILRLTSTMLVLAAAASGCGSGSADDPSEPQAAGGPSPDSPLLDIPDLEEDSPYVRSLCDIDFLGVAELDDPLQRVIDAEWTSWSSISA